MSSSWTSSTALKNSMNKCNLQSEDTPQAQARHGGGAALRRNGALAQTERPMPPPPRPPGLCLKGRGGHRGSPRAVAEWAQGMSKRLGGGRFLAVGNAVGAGVGVWECLWGRVRAVPPPPFKRFPAPPPKPSGGVQCGPALSDRPPVDVSAAVCHAWDGGGRRGHGLRGAGGDGPNAGSGPARGVRLPGASGGQVMRRVLRWPQPISGGFDEGARPRCASGAHIGLPRDALCSTQPPVRAFVGPWGHGPCRTTKSAPLQTPKHRPAESGGGLPCAPHRRAPS